MKLNVYSHELMNEEMDFSDDAIIETIEADSFESAAGIANEKYGSNDYSWSAQATDQPIYTDQFGRESSDQELLNHIDAFVIGEYEAKHGKPAARLAYLTEYGRMWNEIGLEKREFTGLEKKSLDAIEAYFINA